MRTEQSQGLVAYFIIMDKVHYAKEIRDVKNIIKMKDCLALVLMTSWFDKAVHAGLPILPSPGC